MQSRFDAAFSELLESWRVHEALRSQHAPFLELLDARTRLMNARVAASRARRGA